MKKIIYVFSLASISLSAIPVFAETVKNFQGLVDLIISSVLKPIVPLLVGLAVVVFIYGVIIIMFSEGGEKKEQGKMYMIWGIIGIFVMVSVWGLVNILQSTFNLDPNVPVVQIKLN